VNISYFKAMFKKFVVISLQESIALSGGSRKECLGLRNTGSEVRGGQQALPISMECWLEWELIAFFGLQQ